MELRIIALCLLLWFPPVFANPISDADAMEQMDAINTLLYQYPNQAFEKISKLEKKLGQHQSSNIPRLRLSLLRCETLMELGESEAAINIAQMGDAQAKILRLEQARPYFLNCMADAYTSFGNLAAALPLFDSAVQLAKRYQQPQALVNSLRQRGQIDIETNNYAAAIEDLRLALDIYTDIENQAINWSWPPQAYMYGAMGYLFHSTGDLKQALHYANLSLQTDNSIGKIKQITLRNAARVHLDNGNLEQSDKLLTQSKALLSDIKSPVDLAFSYSIIASLDFARGRLKSAEQLAQLGYDIFKNQNKPINIMRSQRLMAQIKFAKNENKAALLLVESAVKQGERLKQHSDLVDIYQILANFHAEQGHYQKAYEYVLRQYNSNEQAQSKLNNARFIQYKARLNQHDLEQSKAEQSISQFSEDKTSQLSWAYSIIFVLSMIVLGIFIWYLVHRSNRRFLNEPLPVDGDLPIHQQLDLMLSGAKKASSPLALILFDTSHIRQVDLSQALETIRSKLREQDMLLRYAAQQAIVILPYTSPRGAEKVSEQLLPQIQQWQPKASVTLGLAHLQQFDTLQSMVRRASVNQLRRAKSADK